ncbi:VOC family protein [Microvirga thermotolerans]|uniref:VOC family protein n=1 Tax=Microvirga thermotolerans TaxID=2651334 RepID=A0A5P9JYX5_9HYPH|nr:VOC family protein [Microvirga thermotolerans]QFU18042.1 VOC family protein [Microvirga thermotolerans]
MDVDRDRGYEALRKVVWEGPSGVEMSPKGKASLCLYQTDEKPAHLHLAFTAESRRQVDALYRAALEAGGKDNGAPGLRLHDHANYYAAFVIGPDGHNIEVVCHKPET